MSTQSDRDALLADVLTRLSDARRRGEAVNLEVTVAEHPELADELRELWDVVVLTDVVASDESTMAMSGTPSSAQELTGALPDATPLPEEFGDYEIREEIGRGGMGVVYRAYQRSLGREVALKVLLHGAHASASDIARFRSEAQAAAALDHPHVVSVYEVGDINGLPFFTMQLIEGTTLLARLAQGPMQPREAAALLAPVCDAVHYAHSQGVLHRDLKPSNILIDHQGRPHVTDFGLAKRLNADVSLTRSGAIVGTPSYMAPEQASGEKKAVTAQADVYSLGAVLYQMLAGRPPFQAATPMGTLLQAFEEEPLAPRILNRQADPELEMVALKCLQKPTDIRYATVADLARDLRSYLANEPVSAQSGAFRQVVGRLFRATHNAVVLENWGLLWLLHSLVVLILCLSTNYMQLRGVTDRWPYPLLFIAGFGAWAAAFWALRRRAGPVTFVERQIAHVWGASMVCCAALFALEMQMGMPVLRLSPVIALFSGAVFFVKAGILTGAFYVQSGAFFVTALVMGWVPEYALTVFGVVASLSFAIPGLKYFRRRRANEEVQE